MKKIISIVTLILAVALVSFVFLKPSGNEKASKNGFYDGKSKTSQMTKKDEKSLKKSEKETPTTSTETLESNVNEPTSQNEVQTSSNEIATHQQGSEEVTQSQGGLGGWEATSGILDLDKEVSVYVASNKSSEIAFTKPAGSQVEWDKYFSDNGDWWYSFEVQDGEKSVRYYIAYSDVNH